MTDSLTFQQVLRGIIELGFPVIVAVYLLIYHTKQLERVRAVLVEIKIGLALVLDKLGAANEYKDKMKEIRAERKDKHD